MLGVLSDVNGQVRELEQRITQHEALYAADAHLLRSLHVDDVLQALADVAAQVLEADKSSVVMWNEAGDDIDMPAAHGFHPESVAQVLPPDEARFLSKTFLNGPPVFDYTPEALPEGSLLQAVHRREGIRATLAAGIRVRGRVFGAFGISYTRPRQFTDGERQLVLALAEKAALAIENACLYEQAETRMRELEALAAENSRLRHQAERRAQFSEALSQADARLYRSLQLDEVLDALLDVAVGILDSDTAGVWAIDVERGMLAVQAARGAANAFTRALDEVTVLESPLVRQALDSEILVVEDVLDDPRLTPRLCALLERERIRAAVCSPITIDGQVYGLFGVGFRGPRAFGADERQLIVALSQRAGLAIKNARLYEQAQQVAALEERQRLARELHDAVTQTLFSSALIAEVLPELWTIDRGDARLRLDQLRRLTRGALAEMRSLLVELRPGALTELSLPDLLHQLADATSGRTMLDVDVSIEGELEAPLPADVHLAVYRMAQEGLNNVLKHARAHRARLALRFAQHGGLVLRVEDDGIGFDPECIAPGHLGISIMRERAEGIGAHLTVRSARNRGTIVRVRWWP